MERRRIVVGALVAAVVVTALALHFHQPFPPDGTPEGAYARIAKAIAEQRERDVFPYLEQDAQDAAFSIRDMRRAACDAIDKSYPAGAERDALLAEYGPDATTKTRVPWITRAVYARRAKWNVGASWSEPSSRPWS